MKRTPDQNANGAEGGLEQTKLQVEAFEKQKVCCSSALPRLNSCSATGRRTRIAGHGRQHGVAHGESVALGDDAKGQYAGDGRIVGFHQFRRELITSLKRSGYFSKVEIKETKQDEKNLAVQTFVFQISAEITPHRQFRRVRPVPWPRPQQLRRRRRKDKGRHANPFRDMSVIMQALVAAAVAVVLVLVGSMSPDAYCTGARRSGPRGSTKDKLNQEVQQLSVYKQRYGELKQQMDALSSN